ncbi:MULTISPECIES: PqqD family protein [unclassified Frankia]|uniref:PqqD family protein n=1 Tax=unclassified Frankia TaxID=2632575 RepID=UPI0027DD3C87|nr:MULTISPECIES: PqqD family protein [unclassified Frankia]
MPDERGRALPRLCVGMATYDDFDGVWFTIQAIRLYKSEVSAELSFVVIDNHPEGAAAEALRALADWIPGYRYVPFAGYRGTAVRDLVFRETEADIVCCVDSHVLLRPGALTHLVNWFDAHPESRDLLQGPLLYDSLGEPAATHLEPTWGAGMFGQWGRDPRVDDPSGEPFEIAMQGLGLFACRREAWPGLNPRLRGFGAEEGYLHEKFRQRGARVLCHPGLGWLHRFPRPAGTGYANRWEDRIRNYQVAWSEVGWDHAPIEEHFRELLGPDVDADAVFGQARAQSEHPLAVFDAVLCVAGDDEACAAHTHPADVAWRVERVTGDAEPAADPEWRRLSRWRAAITAAARRGYGHVLVVDDPAGPVVPTWPDHRDQLAVVADENWDVCLLPAPAPRGGGSAPVTVAVHQRAYERLLADFPHDAPAFMEFRKTWGDPRRYLRERIADGFLTAVDLSHDWSDDDRPVLAPGNEVIQLTDGFLVRQFSPPREHRLNNTAAVILELCDGDRTVAQIAESLAEAFALAPAPSAEVANCVAQLREIEVLAESGIA